MKESALDSLRNPIKAPKPLRLMITAGATAAFYDIEDDQVRSQVVERLVEVCRNWRNRPDAKFITGHKRWSIYLLFDVDVFDTVVDMIDELRHGSVSLWRYFTVSTCVGRHFWPIEDGAH